MTLARFAPKLPVPVMQIHSVDDMRALYEGGLGPTLPIADTRVFHPPVESMLKKWIAHNGCPQEAKVADLVETREGPDDGHTASRLVYSPCRGGTEVVLWKLTGAGHVWPGGQRDFVPLPITGAKGGGGGKAGKGKKSSERAKTAPAKAP